jgi:hypothetical protein
MRALLLLTLLLLSACVCGQADPGKTGPNTSAQGVIEVQATVRFIPLEGGFFGLVASDGVQYDPTNLAKEFQQDGLEVKATLRLRRGVVSYRMWGTTVDVVAMEKR